MTLAPTTPNGDKPTVYLGLGGIPTYSASALGGCLRALVAARSGYDPIATSNRLQKIFDAGHNAEEHCVTSMFKAGWTFFGMAQSEVQLVIHLNNGKHAIVLGHIDEQGAPPSNGQRGIVEVKSQGPSTWADYEHHGPRGTLWERYSWQISCYMNYYSLPAYWVRWRRPKITDGVPDIDTPTWDVHPLAEPPFSLADITARIQEIEDWAERGDFPPCSLTKEWDCSFRYLHGDDDAEAEEIVVVSGLSDLAREYDAAKNAEETASRQRDEARKKILSLLESAGHTDSIKVRDESALVVVTNVQGSRLDEKLLSRALKDAGLGADLTPFRTPGKAYRRVEVRVPKP